MSILAGTILLGVVLQALTIPALDTVITPWMRFIMLASCHWTLAWMSWSGQWDAFGHRVATGAALIIYVAVVAGHWSVYGGISEPALTPNVLPAATMLLVLLFPTGLLIAGPLRRVIDRVIN